MDNPQFVPEKLTSEPWVKMGEVPLPWIDVREPNRLQEWTKVQAGDQLNMTAPFDKACVYKQNGKRIVFFPRALGSQTLHALHQYVAPLNEQTPFGVIADWIAMMHPVKDPVIEDLKEKHAKFDPETWQSLLDIHLKPLLDVYIQHENLSLIQRQPSTYDEIRKYIEYMESVREGTITGMVPFQTIYEEFAQMMKNRLNLSILPSPPSHLPARYGNRYYYASSGNALDYVQLETNFAPVKRVAEFHYVLPYVPLDDMNLNHVPYLDPIIEAEMIGIYHPYFSNDPEDERAIKHFKFMPSARPSLVAGLSVATTYSPEFLSRMWASKYGMLEGIKDPQEMAEAQFPFLLLHMQKHLRKTGLLQSILNNPDFAVQ